MTAGAGTFGFASQSNRIRQYSGWFCEVSGSSLEMTGSAMLICTEGGCRNAAVTRDRARVAHCLGLPLGVQAFERVV